MQNIRPVTDSVIWVGASDRRLALFENMFPVPDGVSYNSYVILDEKVAILDTADSSVTAQYLENVAAALGDRQPDYLIVNHMEPDHCANIEELCRRYPGMKLVGNSKTFGLMAQFYDFPMEERMITVKERDILDLGHHKLTFVMAPMVHWPEAMMTYDTTEKILFSADAFGSFGALDGVLFSDEHLDFKALHGEMRRYYSNIVGKYGMQVQAVLKRPRRWTSPSSARCTAPSGAKTWAGCWISTRSGAPMPPRSRQWPSSMGRCTATPPRWPICWRPSWWPAAPGASPSGMYPRPMCPTW